MRIRCTPPSVALLAALLLVACAPGATSTPPGPSDGRPAALAHVQRHALDGDALVLERAVDETVSSIAARELGLRRLVLRPDDAPSGRNARAAGTIDPRLRTFLDESRPPAWLWLIRSGEGAERDETIEGWLDARATRVGDERFGAGAGALRLQAWRLPPDLAADEYPPTLPPVELGPLELLGWSVSPEPLMAGRAARVTLAWLVNQAEPAPALRFSLALLDERDQDRASTGVSGAPFGGLHPPPSWPPMDITVAPHALAIPEDLPPGRYRLTLRVRPEEGAGMAWPTKGPLELGAVRVVAPPRTGSGAR